MFVLRAFVFDLRASVLVLRAWALVLRAPLLPFRLSKHRGRRGCSRIGSTRGCSTSTSSPSRTMRSQCGNTRNFSGLSVYCVSAVGRCELFGVRAVGSGSSRGRNSVNSSGVGVLLVLRSASRYPQSQEPERHGSLVGHGQAGRLLLLVFVQAWGSPRSHLLGQDCGRACGHA